MVFERWHYGQEAGEELIEVVWLFRKDVWDDGLGVHKIPVTFFMLCIRMADL